VQNTDLSHKPSKAGNVADAPTESPASKTGPTPPPRWPYWIAAVCLIADQVTKQWFHSHYDYHESRVVIPGFFNFTYAHNPGAAFSIFQGYPTALLVFSMLIFCLMVVFRDHLFSRTRLEQVAYGFIVGGVLGNLIDRMKHGFVIDFIDWYVGDWHWPIFNLADTWICTGVGLYLLSQWRNRHAPEIKAKA